MNTKTQKTKPKNTKPIQSLNIKLKEGKEVLREVFEIPTLEEYLNREHIINFYHSELDIWYEVGFNPKDKSYTKLPFELLNGWKDKIDIDNLEWCIRHYSPKWLDDMTDNEQRHIDIWFHLWLNRCGEELLTSIYYNLIRENMIFTSTSLFDDYTKYDVCDIRLNFQPREKNRFGKKWELVKEWYEDCDFTETYYESDTPLSEEDIREFMINRNWKHGKVDKVGRNDKCPCGSGIKFKKCCLS